MHNFSFLTAIGNAYAVLSNTNKRKQYDECGEETRHPSRHNPDDGNFEPDISPEDLFNMFFGGGYPSSWLHYFLSSYQDCDEQYFPCDADSDLSASCGLGNANVYTNGRMRYQRPERRPRQRDVSLMLHIELLQNAKEVLSLRCV